MPTPERSPSDIAAMVQEMVDSLGRMQQGNTQPQVTLKADWHDTPLGPILLAGDDKHLHLAGFLEKSSLVRKASLVRKKMDARLEPGESASTRTAKRELDEYFAGSRRSFETPANLSGSAFQKRVWEELARIPFGETVSYHELASYVERPAAFRAVAQASTQNLLTLLVPCHRVINANGDHGGYDGGSERKGWLLAFEKRILGQEQGDADHSQETPLCP